MTRTKDLRYTHVPRTILWLVPGGQSRIGGEEDDAHPSFVAQVEPFYLSKTPISNAQYQAFDPGFRPPEHSPGPRDPAVGVSYEAALGYCQWYAEVSRKPMRLPTEVEWEHACRGGEAGSRFYAEDEDPGLYQWDASNSGGRVPDLEEKKANPFGLFGMLGGVWEWTASPYLPYPPKPGQSARRRVLRGGSFRSPRQLLSCSVRRPEETSVQLDDVGFRVAKSLR